MSAPGLACPWCSAPRFGGKVCGKCGAAYDTGEIKFDPKAAAQGDACPWCSAPRGDGLNCPRCGANYAKAAEIKAKGRAEHQAGKVVVLPEHQVGTSGTLEENTLTGLAEVEDPEWEYWSCVLAIPCALALGLLFHLVMPGIQRIFFGMPVHELGHAVAAWFTGHVAIPTVWKTLTFERGPVMPVILAAGIGWLTYKAWRAGNGPLIGVCIGLFVLQFVGTLVLKDQTAGMLFTYGGDGFGMVIATLLMASFFFGKGTDHYRGALRWGFLVIGAAAFTDMFSTWITATWDRSAIPFGEIEGVGESDPVKLVAWYFWSETQMVRRYVWTGVCCLVVLALVYAWGVREAWKHRNIR